MDHLVCEFIAYYHEERPPPSRDDERLMAATPNEAESTKADKNDKPLPDVIPELQVSPPSMAATEDQT